MKRKPSNHTSGFTLVELLIVVAILSLLLGLLTPAILKNLKIAGRTRNTNERALLEGAMMEYWHDKGVWPLPKQDPKESQRGSYSKSYKDDNYLVIQELLEKSVGGKAGGKDYFDPGQFMTTRKTYGVDPEPEAVRLIDALEGKKRCGEAQGQVDARLQDRGGREALHRHHRPAQ